jgi:hypothetical protein
MKTCIYGILFAVCMFFTSCQMCTRTYGGTSEIKLPKGEKLVMATFKNNNIWFLTESMDSDYIPKTKHMYESSLMGVFEGEVIFYESK